MGESGGGRFEFDDGGSYSGGWEDGKAHGFGVCTGPGGQGEYAGAWTRGFEVNGVYTWPSGNSYSGEWHDGKRHGVGLETKGHWIYRGEWTQGYKGRYGVRQSAISGAKYEGTWTTSYQDGYGVETYIDAGTYQGQWQKGMRHGYGVRQSVPFGIAAQYRDKENLHASVPAINHHGNSAEFERGRSGAQTAPVTDRSRGGFVLTDRSISKVSNSSSSSDSNNDHIRSRSSSIGRSIAERFRLRKQQSTGDIPRSVHRSQSHENSLKSSKAKIVDGPTQIDLGGVGDTGQENCLLPANVDASVVETYMGEWKGDKRSGFGMSERSDGLKYVGEWYNDKKYGYGVTFFKDGTKEEGRYKDNELISSGKKRKIFSMSKTKLRDRVDAAVSSAMKAADVAVQKSEVALARKANAILKADLADKSAQKAIEDSEIAREEADKFNRIPSVTKQEVQTVSNQIPSQSKPDQFHHRSQNEAKEARDSNIKPAASEPVKTASLSRPPRVDSSDSNTSKLSSAASTIPLSPTSKSAHSPAINVDNRLPVDQTSRTPHSANLSTRQTTVGPTSTGPPVRSQRTIMREMTPQLNDLKFDSRRSNQEETSSSSEPRFDGRTTDERTRSKLLQGMPGGHVNHPRESSGYGRMEFRNGFKNGNQKNWDSFEEFSDSTESGGKEHIGVSSSNPSQPPPHSSFSSSGVQQSLGESPPRIIVQQVHSNQISPASERFPFSSSFASHHHKEQQLPSKNDNLQETRSSVLSDFRSKEMTTNNNETFSNFSSVDGRSSSAVIRASTSSFRNRLSNRENRFPESQHHGFDQPTSKADYLDDTSRDVPYPDSVSYPIHQQQQHHHHHHHHPQQQQMSSGRSFLTPQDQRRDYSSVRMRGPFEGSDLRTSGGGTETISNLSSSWDTLRRRRTLPCIVSYPQQLPVRPSPGLNRKAVQENHSRAGGGGGGIDGRGVGASTQNETYIVENGIRKRLVADSVPVGSRVIHPSPGESSTGADRGFASRETTEPRLQRLTLESTSDRKGIKSSLPDVYRIRDEAAIMPREEVSILSQRRRDELRREREAKERGTLIIRMVDVKEWAKENQLIILLVALNLGLAAMFFNFLIQSKHS